MTIKQSVRVHIRHMLRRDMPEVLAIDEFAGLPVLPSSRIGDREEGFLTYLRVAGHWGMIAEECGRQYGKVLGFMLYELNDSEIILARLAVHPAYLRMGVGTQLAEKLQSKVSPWAYQARSRVVMDVSEYALPMQLFLRSRGWLAERVIRGQSDGGDAYRMVYRLCAGG